MKSGPSPARTMSLPLKELILSCLPVPMISSSPSVPQQVPPPRFLGSRGHWMVVSGQDARVPLHWAEPPLMDGALATPSYPGGSAPSALVGMRQRATPLDKEEPRTCLPGSKVNKGRRPHSPGPRASRPYGVRDLTLPGAGKGAATRSRVRPYLPPRCTGLHRSLGHT